MLGWEKSVVLTVKCINNLISVEYDIFVMKHCFFVEVKMKKYFFWFNQKYAKYQMIVKT